MLRNVWMWRQSTTRICCRWIIWGIFKCATLAFLRTTHTTGGIYLELTHENRRTKQTVLAGTWLMIIFQKWWNHVSRKGAKIEGWGRGYYRNRKHMVGRRKYDETRYQNQENELWELGGYLGLDIWNYVNRGTGLYFRILYTQFRFHLVSHFMKVWSHNCTG